MHNCITSFNSMTVCTMMKRWCFHSVTTNLETYYKPHTKLWWKVIYLPHCQKDSNKSSTREIKVEESILTWSWLPTQRSSPHSWDQQWCPPADWESTLMKISKSTMLPTDGEMSYKKLNEKMDISSKGWMDGVLRSSKEKDSDFFVAQNVCLCSCLRLSLPLNHEQMGYKYVCSFSS